MQHNMEAANGMQQITERQGRDSLRGQELKFPTIPRQLEQHPELAELRAPTFSIVVGNKRCNASCQFCSSKMEPPSLVRNDGQVADFSAALAGSIDYAQQQQIATVQITSKGEPTLFPDEITDCLGRLRRQGFSSIELQTNGILLARNPMYQEHLQRWRSLGLTVIAVSIVHYDSEMNRAIYLPQGQSYIDLQALALKLHQHGFIVRLSCTLLKGYLDSPESIDRLLDFASSCKVEELNLRPVKIPHGALESARNAWVQAHSLSAAQIVAIEEHLARKGSAIAKFPHGAYLYQVGEQKVCFSSGRGAAGAMPRLILLPDGRLETDWP